MCVERCLEMSLKMCFKTGLQKEPSKWALISFRNRYTPPSRSTFEASWKIANENSSKKNKMDLVKSNSQVFPIQGGFLTLLITSSFSGVYVLCVCACLRACMCGVFVCVCVCVSHPPLSPITKLQKKKPNR